MRWEARKMLPCMLSIRWEKRWLIALRRLSAVEGRSVGTSSWASGGGGRFVSIFEGRSRAGGREEELRGGVGGFDKSAKSRVCDRILHCKQMGVRNDGRLGIRNVRRGFDKGTESEKRRGRRRLSGCIAAIPLGRVCCRRQACTFLKVGM